MPQYRVLMGVGLLLAACLLTACGGLAGEQPIVATLTPAPTEVIAPQGPADLANGKAIYQEHCTACHGANGTGQGELVANGQVPPMASFLDWTRVASARPNEYYTLISEGKIDSLMPPWKNSLTPEQRWDVTMYVYTLRYNAEQIARGEEVYKTECATCHGDTGAGDGESMIQDNRRAAALNDIEGLAAVSDNAYLTTIREGVGDEMPAYQDILPEADIRAAAAYARMFTVNASEATATQEATFTSLTIHGAVTNGTAGSFVPTDTQVFLRYGSQAAGLQTEQATLNADGSYTFADVPYDATYGYVTFVSYEGNNFTSEVFSGEDVSADLELPITLYEPTDDPRLISIAQIDMDIETQTISSVGTGLVVGQTLTYRNSSDRVFSLPAQGQQVAVSLLIQMPPSAVLLQVDDPSRYIVAEKEGAIIDTLPVLPGDHTVTITYYLPYSDGAIIDQPFTNAINGPVKIRLAPTHLHLQDDRFTLHDPAEGEAFHTYTAQIETPYNDSLRFEITGALTPARTSDNPRLLTSNALVPVLVVLLIGLVVLAVWLAWRARKPRAASQNKIDGLVRQIAELDQQHNQGHINHDVYQRQRAELKAQLSALMRSDPHAPPSANE